MRHNLESHMIRICYLIGSIFYFAFIGPLLWAFLNCSFVWVLTREHLLPLSSFVRDMGYLISHGVLVGAVFGFVFALVYLPLYSRCVFLRGRSMRGLIIAGPALLLLGELILENLKRIRHEQDFIFLFAVTSVVTGFILGLFYPTRFLPKLSNVTRDTKDMQ